MSATDRRPPSGAPARPEGSAALPAVPSGPAGSRFAALRGHSLPTALLIVLGLYGASAFFIPTLAPVGVSDDFLYARSVNTLLTQGKIVILPAAAVTLVFQILWGALFQFLFGHSFGVLRVGTVVFTVCGGAALYCLCRELGLNKVRSALGVAVFLFSPLGYVLSFTFMTDSYLVTLLIIATYLYARGLRNGVVDRRWVLAGSVASSLAFLVRHQGILVAVAVLTYLWVSGALRRDRAPLRLALRVIAVPAATAILYLLWFRFIHGVPKDSAQVNYFSALGEAGISGVAQLVRQLFFIEIMFIGLFALPVGLSALPRLPSLVASTSRRGWMSFVVLAVAGGLAAITFGHAIRMPYAQQFFNVKGLGPGDLHGGRQSLVTDATWDMVTVICAVAAAIVLFSVCRRLHLLRTPGDAAAGVAVSVLIWQAAGVVAVSMILRTGPLSYDRYLLPLLPFVICIALWALRDVRLNLPIAFGITAAMALFSVAGTHDFLNFQATTWRVAEQAHREGVPYATLDAGASWDGNHLYEYSYTHKIVGKLPKGLKGALILSKNDVIPWWVGFYAPAVQSDYIVSAEPLVSYTVVRQVSYSSWLLRTGTYIYLLRRPDVKGPP